MSPLSIGPIEQRSQDLIRLLRTLVEIESPTDHKPGLDRIGELLGARMQELGARVERQRMATAGDHWLGTWGEGPGAILMLVHLDTVHPLGTLARFPWREEGDRIYGPGILDMKASPAMALTAIAALREADRLPERRISLLCTSDEETGSHTSVGLIQDLARGHPLVLCLEPALPDGALKTWRKGTGIFDLRIEGRSAHAGANPGDGINAIHELARVISALVELADESQGTTISVGLIRGGTRTNVIPAHSSAKIDVRIQNQAEQSRLDQALAQLAPLHPEAKLTIQGEWNRPPMPRDRSMVESFERARAIGGLLGLELSEGGTGGGSDANFVAPLGVSVLDGLGAVGGGAHTEEEFVLRRSLVERTALLAALLTDW